MNDGRPWLQNLEAEPVKVLHAKLQPYLSTSARECPVCNDGLLLLHRDKKTFKMQRRDRCTVCGQLVIYQDDEVRGETLE